MDKNLQVLTCTPRRPPATFEKSLYIKPANISQIFFLWLLTRELQTEGLLSFFVQNRVLVQTKHIDTFHSEAQTFTPEPLWPDLGNKGTVRMVTDTGRSWRFSC